MFTTATEKNEKRQHWSKPGRNVLGSSSWKWMLWETLQRSSQVNKTLNFHLELPEIIFFWWFWLFWVIESLTTTLNLTPLTSSQSSSPRKAESRQFIGKAREKQQVGMLARKGNKRIKAKWILLEGFLPVLKVIFNSTALRAADSAGTPAKRAKCTWNSLKGKSKGLKIGREY